MIGNLTIDKASMNISYFLNTVRLISVNNGKISRADFVQQMAEFIGVPAKKMSKKTVREALQEREDQSKSLIPWKTGVVNSALLKSKQPYQRNISVRFVKQIIENFNPNALDPVHVSYREGKYYVIDGQHTVVALEGINGGNPVDIPCIIHKGMTYTDEARYYTEQYIKKHRHTYNEMQLAMYEAGDKSTCEIAEKLRVVGAAMPYDRNAVSGIKIGAIKRTQKAYEKDADCTILAVRCLVEAYKGRVKTLPGDIVSGTMEFIRMYRDEIVLDKLTEVLSEYTPQTLSNTAKNLRMSYPINWTETLRDKYNRKIRRNKIKPKYV